MLQLRDPRYRRDILREARNIWQKMVDVNDKTVRMTDDGGYPRQSIAMQSVLHVHVPVRVIDSWLHV